MVPRRCSTAAVEGLSRIYSGEGESGELVLGCKVEVQLEGRLQGFTGEITCFEVVIEGCIVLQCDPEELARWEKM